ncbi:MAG: alpha-glucan family phosphorylase [Candidatus Nanoarchaeia archaeon]|nr:alpha-glucan family phosphorylase [Candidatus Nanoarchaeia archaeon]
MELYSKIQNKEDRLFAYFSMEVGLNEEMQTYSGGLGILAGDTIKSFADRSVPIVCITLLNEEGYFKQQINNYGEQIEYPYGWDKSKFTQELENIIELDIHGRKVKIRAWEYRVKGETGYEVPIYFLDTNIEGNSDYDKTLTKHLYGGDNYYRLCQEIILGIGGIRFLESRGYNNLLKYHMNEGHAAFLTIELLHQNNMDQEIVKKKCVFTTHTPVGAGHDVFSQEDIKKVLGDYVPEKYFHNGTLSMTYLGLNNSHFVNGVAKKHGEISQRMFPKFNINYITNGVHSQTWTSESFSKLFDEKIPEWRKDPFALRYAAQLYLSEVWDAHLENKKKLIDLIREKTGVEFDEEVFTIGFARRATGYKRMDLIFNNIQKLIEISNKVGKIQLVFAGKAHIKDTEGKMLIKKIWDMRFVLGKNIKLVFLENYNMELAKVLIPGVDLWLNTPKRPLEASGTSGMKACHNAIPSLSILDGWWIEGHMENYTGWSIGDIDEYENDDKDAQDLYYKLEKIIMPMFYEKRDDYIKIMRNSIALNASFFNTNRMVSQYVLNAYLN